MYRPHCTATVLPAVPQAAKKKLEKLEKQALGWGGFDDTAKPQEVRLLFIWLLLHASLTAVVDT